MQINQSLATSGLFSSQSQKSRASLDGSDPNAAPFHAQAIAEMESRKEQAPPEGVTFRSTSLPSIDTIMEYWGTANAIADLNTDGIVDSADLGIVLSSTPPADEGGTADDEDSATAQRMQGITAAHRALEEALQSGSPGQMIERLANVIFKTLDQDGDGLLVPGDLPLQPKMFAKFDADENQRLSQRELIDGLSVEFNTYNQVTGEADYGAFAKRWLAAFEGLLPEPNYDNRQAVLASRFGLTGSDDAIAAQSPRFLSVRA